MNESDYLKFISYLNNAGVLIIKSYDSIYEDSHNRKLDYFYVYLRDRFYQVYGSMHSIEATDKKNLEIYSSYKHLNWYQEERIYLISGLACIIKKIRMKYILQNTDTDKWLFLKKGLNDFPLFIEEKNVEEYKSKWGNEEFQALMNTFNKVLFYHILIQYVNRKINITSLKKLSKSVSVLFNILPEKHIHLVSILESYFINISSYNFYNEKENCIDIAGNNIDKYIFSNADYNFISELTNLSGINKMQFNKIESFFFAKRLMGLIEKYKNLLIEKGVSL